MGPYTSEGQTANDKSPVEHDEPRLEVTLAGETARDLAVETADPAGEMSDATTDDAQETTEDRAALSAEEKALDRQNINEPTETRLRAVD